MFLQCYYPKCYEHFLKPRQSVYNTCRSQADGVVLEVQHFVSSVYKSTKLIGLSLACDATKIWPDLV